MDGSPDISLVPIGRVESQLTDAAEAPKQGFEGGPDAWLVLEPRVLDGLDGLDAGLQAIDELEGLDDYHYLHAARADILRRLGRAHEARAAYERALTLVHSNVERRFLERQLERVL